MRPEGEIRSPLALLLGEATIGVDLSEKLLPQAAACPGGNRVTVLRLHRQAAEAGAHPPLGGSHTRASRSGAVASIFW